MTFRPFMSEEERRQRLERLSRPVPEMPDISDSAVFASLDKYFRIGNYELSKSLLESRTQDAHAEHAKNASPDEFIAVSAPVVYNICKLLYENKDNAQYGQVVEEARQFLKKGFDDYWLHTLSRMNWKKRGLDELLHDYKQASPKSIKSNFVGSDGYITSPETGAEVFVQALFDTTDDMQTVNEVFKYVTGRDSYAWRFNKKANGERAVVLGIGNDDVIGRCNISASDSVSDYGPAFGVRKFFGKETGGNA